MEKASKSSEVEVQYELPDGQVITIRNERFRCPELLFDTSLVSQIHPSLTDEKNIGIGEAVVKIIMKSDVIIKKNSIGTLSSQVEPQCYQDSLKESIKK